MATAVNIEINAKDKATAVISGMVKSVGGGLSSLSVMGGNLAAQGVSMAIGSIKELAMSAIDMGGKLTDASLKTGISAKQLQIFWDAAKMAGMEADSFDAMIVKMNKNLASGAAADSLKELGMSAKDLSGKGPAQQFEMIGAALADVKDQGAKTKLAMDIFGKSGADVFAMLGNSSEEFKANLKDSADNVRPMSDSVVAYLDVMGDSMDRAKQNAIAMAGEGIAYAASIAKQLWIPVADYMAKQMADLSAWNKENSDGWQMMAKFGIDAFNGIAASIQMLWATGKLGLKNLVDEGRIDLENLVEIGFWLYDNFATVFNNIPKLASIAFKTVAQIVGGVFNDIVNGNLGGIGATIDKALSDAGKQTQSIGISKLQLEDPKKAIDQNWQEYYAEIASMNTDVWSDVKKATEKGISEIDSAGGKKKGPGPLADMVNKEKKAKAELADLYASGTASAYDMLAKAGSLNSSPVAAAVASTAYTSNPTMGGDILASSNNSGKLDQMISKLTSMDTTLQKIKVA